MTVIYLLVVLSLFSTCNSECQSRTFGNHCIPCNCELSCNTTSGECTQSKCLTAWSGPTCQKFNVALNKSAQQSSTHTNGKGETFPPENAVDGNTDGTISVNGTCMHTRPYNPTAWWRVNLGQVTAIKSVRIYDRTNGGNKQRIGGYRLYVSNITNFQTSGINCFTRITSLPEKSDERVYDQTCTATGQYLTIYLGTRSEAILDFCEVEVYVCSNGTYGEDCANQCGFCLNDDTCSQINGHCPNGCSAGYQGNRCDQVCMDGNYGENCKQKCGNCYQNDTCSRFNGSCPNGCKPGFKGNRCKTACDDGRYGMNCKYECGNCFNGTVCTSTTGNCENGCDPGYQTVFCNQTCQGNTYGEQCRNRCGECEAGESCNPVSGICDNGCAPGYYPPFCQHECVNNTYGKHCEDTCGMCDMTSQCDTSTGVCPSGCIEGYYNDICKEKCQEGYYGKNCNRKCGKCFNGKICDYKNGICDNGCEIGYTKERCDKVCNRGTYGLNCNYTCPNCVNNTCNNKDGSCTTCVNGWQGITCQERIIQPETSNGGIIAGVVVAVLALIVLLCIVIVYKLRNQKSEKSKPERNGSSKTISKDNSIQGNKVKNQSVKTFGNEKLYANDSFKRNLSKDEDNVNPEENAAMLYYNFETVDKSITLSKLKEYVYERVRSEELEKEFKEIPRGCRFPCTEGEKKINKEKNRFKTTFPYDHSRVIIPVIPEQNTTGYINANYIDSVNEKGRYIATQGPKIATIWDFWSMVWTQKSGKIIMLTDLIEGHKIKCDKYWPDIDESISSKQYQLSFREEQEHSVYVVRILQLTDLKTNESRNIQQYHFTRWPDHGVPDPFQLLQFHRHVLRVDNTLDGPMIVHCSAGLGRTGTFIALDTLLENGRKTQKVDIRSFVEKMRNSRMDMIQTDKQYVFLHHALLEGFAVLIPSISKENFMEERIEGPVDYAQTEFMKLKEMENQYTVEDYKHALFQENVKKNRTRNILPVDIYRPYLSSYLSGANDYINAVIVPDCCRKFGFILTQLPLECTVCDFWRLLLDHESNNVICLESPSKDGKPYWPTNGESLSFDSRLLVENAGKSMKGNGYTIHKITLKYKGSSEEKRNVKVYELASSVWLDGDETPTDLTPLLQLQDIIYGIQTSDSHKVITLQCLDGALRCGLVCAIFNVIERMRMDGDINIYHTVRQLQIHRPQLVSSEAQYRYCYHAIKEYLNSWSIYGNM